LSTALVQEYLLKQTESKKQQEQAEDRRESEREIRHECSEAWNEFRYSINKSWGEIYRFIVQPTLKSPGISVPGSAGIQRPRMFNICQFAMRHSAAAEESSMHFFSPRILNQFYRAGYILQTSLLLF
jgi:hypothetical protein